MASLIKCYTELVGYKVPIKVDSAWIYSSHDALLKSKRGKWSYSPGNSLDAAIAAKEIDFVANN